MSTADHLFTLLAESGIVETAADGAVELDDEFQTAISRRQERLVEMDTISIADELEANHRGPTTALIEGLADDYPGFVACLIEVTERVDDLDANEQMKLTAMTQQLWTGLPPSGGTPDHFFEATSNQLEPLLRLNQKAVVYVWREDCEPCDLVKETLEDIVDSQPAEIALLSVYGPDCAELLYENYEVVGAPTVLFVIEEEIDARLQSAHPKPSYEGEMAYLKEVNIS